MVKRSNRTAESFIENQTVCNESILEQNSQKLKSDRSFLPWCLVGLIIILLVVILNTYVFFIADVSGESMEPTLFDNDKVLVNRYKSIKRGSIVVIKPNDNENRLVIKRVIALEGDKVEIKNGKVYINDSLTPLEENYTKGITQALDWKTYTLKENEVFYLGDNRSNSLDSRKNGVCTTSQVVGVVENWSLTISRLFN